MPKFHPSNACHFVNYVCNPTLYKQRYLLRMEIGHGDDALDWIMTDVISGRVHGRIAIDMMAPKVICLILFLFETLVRYEYCLEKDERFVIELKLTRYHKDYSLRFSTICLLFKTRIRHYWLGKIKSQWLNYDGLFITMMIRRCLMHFPSSSKHTLDTKIDSRNVKGSNYTWFGGPKTLLRNDIAFSFLKHTLNTDIALGIVKD